MKLQFSLLSFFIILFVTGCSFTGMDKKENNGICLKEPSWVLNPPKEKGAIYGVGVAPQNFNGEQAQRRSAIAKATEEIAAQMNTTVSSQTTLKSSSYNGYGSQSMNNVSFQTVAGQKVSATIVESCKNPYNGNFYVLMKAKR